LKGTIRLRVVRSTCYKTKKTHGDDKHAADDVL